LVTINHFLREMEVVLTKKTNKDDIKKIGVISVFVCTEGQRLTIQKADELRTSKTIMRC
jgi:hypothetical protein